jgi:hypothetical protein
MATAARNEPTGLVVESIDRYQPRRVIVAVPELLYAAPTSRVASTSTSAISMAWSVAASTR